MSMVYSIEKPQNPLPLVFDSPHSGLDYPADFHYACALRDLHKTEDKYVDELFSTAPKHGAALIKAHFARSYIDLNRAIDDIDPNLLSEDWPYGDIYPTSRSDSGIGLIRRLVMPGVPVYKQDIEPAAILHRIEHYYKPYHTALESLLNDAHYNFGKVYHINCHSMPSASSYPKRAIGLLGHKPKKSDFVLGDRGGTTCEVEFTRALRDFIKGMGYVVTVNDPFRGVELVERYSSPARGRHSIQLEINKALYMDEDNFEKHGNFVPLQRDIDKIIKFAADYVSAQLTEMAAD